MATNVNTNTALIQVDVQTTTKSPNIDVSKIYENWPVPSGTPAAKIPRWIQREFLSFYLMPAWFDMLS